MEPFERGYGHTLGNALRRTLLSSMPGYAADRGAALPACCTNTPRSTVCSEDVVDILLNLKGVVLKPAQPRARQPSTLKKSGEGVGHGQRHRTNRTTWKSSIPTT